MKVLNLELSNYRNCKSIILDFDKIKTLIIGKNAQGKTNILESIYFLSSLKSPRTSNVQDMINFDKDIMRINSSVLKSGMEIEMSYSYSRDKKRELKLNSVKSTLKDFKSVLKSVLFSSSDMMLLRGSPQDRRDWLDRAISQVYPAYDERLAKYDKIRIQKNNFLKDSLKSGKLNEKLLDVYNEQLSISGSNVIFIRTKYLNEIEKIAREKHRTISETEELSIRYDSSFLGLVNEPVDAQQIRIAYANALSVRRTEEMRRAQSCVGPHRDDVVFYINGQEAVKFSSQGQQRTIVLALKLSELDIILNKTGEEPILLLDDVLAELDDLRQNYLLKSISPTTQTIITSVDTILFEDEFLKDVQICKIENGEII